ncbi:hypothetical protein ACKKBG_A06685 [Auxenochlorella protothecoides x Auxenochlorella symbiontica]|uniref:DJ-1/PfpI domain-containing protein n=1 Tax=Auxenochlorella protothecoides TaxID=3075 RepID=A0A087SET9_AUXPR|nr:hypothetical protein F751_5085 [Auxenochlorella protothecoides]KFM24243.1 hypothetical protein F751_5085 [Auxenochlorella protothecoides]
MSPQEESWDTVGIFVFPGFEPLDAYGPMELFGSMIREGLRKVKRIVFVAETAGPVPSCFGPSTVAEYGLDDCPPLDVLVISGGIGTRILMHNTRVVDWLRSQILDHDVRHVLSVCTGAALLAATGLLDGKPATTNKELFTYIRQLFPAVQWQGTARWISQGKVVTASGVTAGMDAALSIIEGTFGAEVAERVARDVEYIGDWRQASNDPFAHHSSSDDGEGAG